MVKMTPVFYLISRLFFLFPGGWSYQTKSTVILKHLQNIAVATNKYAEFKVDCVVSYIQLLILRPCFVFVFKETVVNSLI